MDIESPVIYHYLTYETELPSPMINHVAENGPPPSQPDLGLYISPFLWSKTRKNVALYLSCIATVFIAYTAGSFAPPASAMQKNGMCPQRQSWLGLPLSVADSPSHP
jgi:hypothetical protein